MFGIDDAVTASIISSGASVAENIGTGLFGWIGARKARAFAREQQQTAYQNDLKMWNLQNAYNTPAAQRKRMEEAGLNPALMYKGAPVNTSSTMPKYQTMDMPTYVHKFNVLSNYQDLRMKKAQADLLEAQAGWYDRKESTNLIGKALDNFVKMYETNKYYYWNPAMARGVLGSVEISGDIASPLEKRTKAQIEKLQNEAITSKMDAELSKVYIRKEDHAALRIYMSKVSPTEKLKMLGMLAAGSLIDSTGRLIPNLGIGKYSGRLKGKAASVKQRSRAGNYYSPGTMHGANAKNWIHSKSKIYKINPKDAYK
jgi:hypothetical protein